MTENGVNTDKIFDGSGIVIGRGAQADPSDVQMPRLIDTAGISGIGRRIHS